MNAFTLPSHGTVRDALVAHGASEDVLSVLDSFKHTPSVTFQRLVERCVVLLELIRQERLHENIHIADAAELIYTIASRMITNPHDDVVMAERRRTDSQGACTFQHEFVWMVLSRVEVLSRGGEELSPSSLDFDTERTRFTNRTVRCMIPSAWWKYLCTNDVDAVRSLQIQNLRYLSRLLDPAFNVGFTKPDAEYYRVLSLSERVTFAALFMHMHVPICTIDHPERTHAAGRFVPARFACHSRVLADLRARLDRYISTSERADLPSTVGELYVARRVLLGEYAAYVRESPNDARVYRAPTTIKRCGFSPDYVLDTNTLASTTHNKPLSSPEYAEMREEIDVATYGLMFSEAAPIRSAGSGVDKGRVIASDYVDLFRRDYFLHWYDWFNPVRMRRMWEVTRHGRRCLPILFDVGSGYLLREGPPLAVSCALLAGIGCGTMPLPRPRETTWKLFPTALEALAEWEYCARECLRGELERPSGVPEIAFTSATHTFLTHLASQATAPAGESAHGAPPPDRPPSAALPPEGPSLAAVENQVDSLAPAADAAALSPRSERRRHLQAARQRRRHQPVDEDEGGSDYDSLFESDQEMPDAAAGGAAQSR